MSRTRRRAMTREQDTCTMPLSQRADALVAQRVNQAIAGYVKEYLGPNTPEVVPADVTRWQYGPGVDPYTVRPEWSEAEVAAMLGSDPESRAKWDAHNAAWEAWQTE